MKNDQDLNKLLTAAQALLNDIEAMRADPEIPAYARASDFDEDPKWFGPFSDGIGEDVYGDMTISWPNLEIRAAHVRDAMNELKKEGAA